ncbi:hypothetical protein GGR52DRAFT_296267 [Hypoxylon sp. FL1284]|nr:hypothetical protein GGR52DRAFT_296267 [Hypoxylon sp. FL1284]
MLRATLRRATPPTSRHLCRTRVSNRSIASYGGGGLPSVPVIRPTLWALAATGTIYIGCAAYDVGRDVRDVKRRGVLEDRQIDSYDELERAKLQGFGRRHEIHSQWQLPGEVGAMLSNYNDAQKLLLGAAAFNTALYAASSAARGSLWSLGHVPLEGRNYTLLTSIFGHWSFLQVGINCFIMLHWGFDVANSPTFGGNGSHLAAFYLSTGILSSLGHHLATVLPTRTYKLHRFAPSLGAGGVVLAIMGVFGASNPHIMVDTILFGIYPVQHVLAASALVDFVGIVIGYPSVLGMLRHAPHLVGLGLGEAYVWYDGERHVWQPSRRLAFNCMKRIHMV